MNSEGCIICANGNDLPDGEHCRACGREGTASGLRAAVIRARGRSEPPEKPIQFDGDPVEAGCNNPVTAGPSLEDEIDAIIKSVVDDTRRYKWDPQSTAWHRAFGRISGLAEAQMLIAARRGS